MSTQDNPADEDRDLLRAFYQIESGLHDLEVGIKALRHADEINLERGEFVHFVGVGLEAIHAQLVSRWEAAFALVRRGTK